MTEFEFFKETIDRVLNLETECPVTFGNMTPKQRGNAVTFALYHKQGIPMYKTRKTNKGEKWASWFFVVIDDTDKGGEAEYEMFKDSCWDLFDCPVKEKATHEIR